MSIAVTVWNILDGEPLRELLVAYDREIEAEGRGDVAIAVRPGP